jgi:ribose/xylose/arabinose/galactoside ABC-type transport system permease subunit
MKNLRAEYFIRKTAIIWVLLLLCLGMAILEPRFINTTNLLLVVQTAAITGILGIGMTIVIITGGIDLSVGSVVAFASVCSAMFGGLASQQMPFIVPLCVGLAAGLFFGLANGAVISYLNFPPFIMTLVTMMISRAIAKLFCNGKPVFGITETFYKFANGFFFGIPNLVVWFALIFVTGAILLDKTVLGSRLFAIGGNEAGARLSGVDTRLIILFAYAFCGLLAGLCGVLMTSYISNGSPITADGYELDAIAASVIGGTSMSGGVGTVWGTVIGALIIHVLKNGLNIMGITVFYQPVIQGLIIFTAVLLDLNSKRKKN